MDAYDANDPSALDDYFGSWTLPARGNLIPPTVPSPRATATKHTRAPIPTLPAQHLVSPALTHTPSNLTTISELPEPDARGRRAAGTGAAEKTAKEKVKVRARRALRYGRYAVLRPGVLKVLLGTQLAGPVREALERAAGRGGGVAALVGAGWEIGVGGLGGVGGAGGAL